MRKKLISFILIISFSFLWVCFLEFIPKGLSINNMVNNGIWMWGFCFLAMNVFYFVFGIFKKFDKITSIWKSFLAGIFLNVMLYTLIKGISYEGSSIANALLYVFPVFIFVFVQVFKKESINSINTTSFIFAFLGVALIYFNLDILNISLTGLIYSLVSALSFAIYLIIIYKDDNKVTASIYFSVISAFVISIIFTIVYGSFSIIKTDLLFSLIITGTIIVLMMIAISLAYRKTNSAYLVTMVYVAPAFVLLFNAIVHNNTLSTIEIVGLTLIGVAVTYRSLTKI